jgi:alginate O-acetyltransferase complex protein AlgI
MSVWSSYPAAIEFNTISFGIFFAAVLMLHSVLPNQRARLGLIFSSSLVFYGTWNPYFIPLLLLSTIVDFTLGQKIADAEDQQRGPHFKRACLALSISTNLGILAYFKYGGFFVSNLNDLRAAMGDGSMPIEAASIVLPMGISFYTFQTMSYTIDVYRGQAVPIRSFLLFGSYVSFFPQLVAGPIVRAGQFFPQLVAGPVVTRETRYLGISRIATGLIKKVLIADWLAALVEPVFRAPEFYGGFSHIFAVYAYAFQILFDFAGYCDIAIGCALLMGYRLPENFMRPYDARSIAEFWRLWHMTLSTWLRDYLYISLGGNRSGRSRTYRNLIITMLLGGLWHGASWNFVIWGGLHGVFLAVHRIWGRSDEESFPPWSAAFQTFLTFQLVCFAWIFFRCQSIEQTLGMFNGIANGLGSFEGWAVALATSLGSLGVYRVAGHLRGLFQEWTPESPVAIAAYGFLLGVGLVALSLFSGPDAQFIYFQF